jgi:photosystem II stability/assembly factor-like uncharacterized protein
MNPQPQGNSLYAVVASHECGVVAVGDQSTLMRSTDDGVTWSTHQTAERWRFKATALLGTDLYVVGDDSNGNVVLKFGSCGEAEPVTVRKLSYKVDGAANGVAVDSDGRIYVSTVFHAEGRMLCSQPKSLDLKVCDDEPYTPFYSLFVDRSGRVFVAGGYQGKAGGVVRATFDHGATWKTLGQHLGTIAYGMFGDADGKRLMATSPGEVHSSMDGGATWKTSPASMMSGGSMMLGKDDAPYIPNDFDVFISGAPDTGTFFVTARGVLRGENFQATTATLLSTTDWSIGFDAAVTTGNGHWIGVGGTGRINRSTDDGKTWSHISKDVLKEGDQFVDIESDARSIFMLRRALFLRSDDNGATFVSLGKEDAPDIQISTRDYVSFAVDHDVVVLPRPKHNAIARSTDRGKTFTEMSPKLAAGQTVVHVWNGGSGVFYGSGAAGAVLRSQDNGLTFTSLSVDPTQDFAAGIANGHDVYLVGSSSASTGGFFHSSDDGKTWKTVPLDFQPYGVRAAGTDLYVVDRYGKFVRSTDQGQSWTRTVDLNCGDVSGFIVQDTHIFVACNSGSLFTSTDRGATFEKKPIAADVELVFSDGHAGLYAASARGFTQLLHYF